MTNKRKPWTHYISLTLLIGIGYFFYRLALSDTPYHLLSYNYLTQYTYTDTGAKNLLSGIYLNYRLFDTVFESSLLFVVTAGILFLGKKDDQVR